MAKDLMENGKISKKELCRRTGLDYKKAKLFFKKKIGVDDEIANALSKGLGFSASTWLIKQKEFDEMPVVKLKLRFPPKIFFFK